MSDFLYSTRRARPGHLCACLERRLLPLDGVCRELHGDWGSLAIASLPHDAPFVDEASDAIRVTLGAEGGPFARIDVDVRSASGRVTTDLMAFIPLFHATARDGALVVGSHVDAVADAAGLGATFDAVAATDFVAHGSIVYPYTLYEGVQQVAPAVVRGFDARGWSDDGVPHWTPYEERLYPSLEEAAAVLRVALADDLSRALAGVDRAGMLLSAGEDSRAVLGAVPAGVRIDAVTFADWESREVRIARRIAHAYGASFRVGLRDFAHYLEAIEPVTSFTGSQHQYVDVHAWRLSRSLGLDALPLVLGGFSSDVLLKGYYSPARARRSQPQKRHPGENDALRVPAVAGVRQELLVAAVARREARRAALRELRPESATEWMRIWPFGVRKPAAAWLGHRRLFRAHEPFMSDAVVRLAAAVPIEWKLDRRLFAKAMRPYLKPSRFIPHGRNTFPYFGRATSLALGAGVGVARFTADVVRGRLGRSQGPWPDWRRLVESDRFAELLVRHPIAGARAAAIFEATSPAAIEAVVRERWSPKQQLMYAQLAFETGAAWTGSTESV